MTPRQHAVAEIVHVHRAVQLASNVPEDFTQLGLTLVGHDETAYGTNARLKG